MACVCQGTFQRMSIFPMTGSNSYGDGVVPESGIEVMITPEVESTTKRGNGADWCECNKITGSGTLKINPYCPEVLEAVYGVPVTTDELLPGATQQCFGFGMQFNDFGLVAVGNLEGVGGDIHFVIHRARATGFPTMGPQDNCDQEWEIPFKILSSQDPESTSDNNMYCVNLHEGTAVAIPSEFPGLTAY